MSIPERFRFESVTDQVVHEMCALCDAVEQAVDRGTDVTALLAKWHERATRTCEPVEFTTYWQAVDKETFVRDAINPVPQMVEDLTFVEALDVLQSVMLVELSESQTSYYLSWLEAQFPGSNISGLIYWPDEWFGDAALFRDENGLFRVEAELTNERILTYAMCRSSRALLATSAGTHLPFPMPDTKW